MNTPTPPTVRTFRQYVDVARREAAAHHGVSLTEAARELPDSWYAQEWEDYMLRAFNDGATIPTRMWRTFDERVQYRVLRSTRALRDNALTRQLVLAAA